MNHIFDISYLIHTVGLYGIFAIIFAESGLFFAFFLPGDSLLFAAGFMASQGLLPFPILVIGCMICSISAGYIGYYFGRTVGHKLFEKADSILFRKKHLEDTKRFFEKYGNKTVVLAHFIPVIRTFSPIFAGIAEMPFRRFSMWNIFGGILWPGVIVTSGFYLGRLVPGAEKYFLPIVLLIVIVSVLPGAYEWYKAKSRKKIDPLA
ncbi:MAG: DedA family protein [bacterium]